MAELTLGYGFEYFIVTSSEAIVDRSTAITTGSYIPTGYGGGFAVSSTQAIPKPIARMGIICFREEPKAWPNPHNARSTYRELSRKYGIQKELEQFPEYTLPIANMGFQMELARSTEPPKAGGRGSMALTTTAEPRRLRIVSFDEDSLAQEAGLRIGDEVLSISGVTIEDWGGVVRENTDWELGQVVEVTIRRNNEELTFPIKTVFNDSLWFKEISDLELEREFEKEAVRVFEEGIGQVSATPVAIFLDYENPVTSLEEFKKYAVAAAAVNGANGILILPTATKLKEFDPDTNEQVGFGCVLLLVPEAAIGVDLESGPTYAQKMVIRRVLSQEARAAGLLIGDTILAFDGMDVVREADKVQSNQLGWKVGQTVRVTVARKGEEVELNVKTVENRQADQHAS